MKSQNFNLDIASECDLEISIDTSSETQTFHNPTVFYKISDLLQ